MVTDSEELGEDQFNPNPSTLYEYKFIRYNRIELLEKFSRSRKSFWTVLSDLRS